MEVEHNKGNTLLLFENTNWNLYETYHLLSWTLKVEVLSNLATHSHVTWHLHFCLNGTKKQNVQNSSTEMSHDLVCSNFCVHARVYSLGFGVNESACFLRNLQLMIVWHAQLKDKAPSSYEKIYRDYSWTCKFHSLWSLPHCSELFSDRSVWKVWHDSHFDWIYM